MWNINKTKPKKKIRNDCRMEDTKGGGQGVQNKVGRGPNDLWWGILGALLGVQKQTFEECELLPKISAANQCCKLNIKLVCVRKLNCPVTLVTTVEQV